MTLQFLQHVAYGEQNEAESLLKQGADSAQELLTEREFPFTDYSGRTFKSINVVFGLVRSKAPSTRQKVCHPV